MKSALKIVMAQMNNSVGTIADNASRIIDACQKARKHERADVIVFPELALTGYPPEDLLLRPGFYRHVEKALQTIADAVKNIDVLLGYPENSAQGIYNAMGHIHQGRLQTVYHKQCLPNYSVFDEKRYFIAGEASVVVTIAGVKVGLLICEDIWLPQPAQNAKAQGAEIICVINASPFRLGKNIERRTLLAKRAQAIQCPIVYCHCVGGQDDLVFDGGSMVMDSEGKLCAHAGYFCEKLLALSCHVENNKLVVEKQTIDKEIYAPSEEALLFNALVMGVRDYVHKNGFSGALIGLSGGIDSAVTLAIAVAALGADHVHAVSMPSRYSAALSCEAAQEQAKRSQVQFSVIPIESLFVPFLDLLAKESEWQDNNGQPVGQVQENLQARIRGIILMALSNLSSKIVLSTSNKSELAIGYTTLYGDMVGGYSALKDVAKTKVYRLAKYINAYINPVIPQVVIDRPPSAELAPNQLDQDTLPPYEVLDGIIEHYVENDRGPEEIVKAGYDKDTVMAVLAMIDQNEFKRRQAAPGVRVTGRAFGRERRYPISSGYGPWKKLPID